MSKMLAELIVTLSEHYDPVPSEMVERFKFNSRVQRVSKSVVDSIAEVTNQVLQLWKIFRYNSV